MAEKSLFPSEQQQKHCFQFRCTTDNDWRESQNHRMVGVGRDLCGTSSPTPLSKQGHLEQAAEEKMEKIWKK